MRIRSKKHLIGLFIILTTLFLSFSNNHPAGNTGAPGDGLCSNCHGGGSYTGSVDITGLPGTVIPDQTYNVTVTLNVNSGTPIRAGFQIVALQDANDTNAGDWTNNSPSSSLITSGGREYFGHSPFKLFGGSSSVSWDADWTAPDIVDNVTFYAVGNFANGNGSTSGDRILTGTETVTVDGGVDLTIAITDQSGVTCFNGNDGGATAEADGGTPPYDYEWDNSETGPMAINLDGGNHSVTVTDDNGDTAQTSVFITEPNEITVDPFIEHISCFDEEDGYVELNAQGGTGFLDCEWSDGIGFGCEQEFLAEGSYFVTVTDNNDCMEVFEIEIFEPTELMVNLSSTDETTAGAEDGTATAIPTGGNPPYNFEWSDGTSDSGTNSTIEDLVPGEYTVEITDDNGCIVDGMVTVMPGTCLLSATSTIEDLDCYGNENGNIYIDVFNFTTPLTFAWSDGSSTQDLIGVAGGNYSVQITDGAGCSEMLNNLIIIEPDSLRIQPISTLDASCSDSEDGMIIVDVSGGVGNYDMVWSNGVTNDTIISGMDTLINIPDTLIDLNPGIYSYSLFDGNECFKTDSLSIGNSDTIPPVLILDQGSVLIGLDGTAGPATFAMVDAGSFDNCTIDSVSFITPSYTCMDIGSYDYPVEIYDSAGNMTSGIATVNVFDTIPPELNCSGLQDIVTSSCDVIEFDSPEATDNCTVEQILIIEGLPSGSNFPSGTTEVVFQAIDECGNSTECSFTVTVNIDLALEVSSQNISCPGENDGVISPSATGGTPPYFFNIDADTLSAGTYVVVLMDSGGCTDMTTIEILEPELINYDLPTIDVSCFGTSDGQIIIDLPDNTSWEFDGDPTMLTSGEYEVTITDAGSGCEVIETVSISQPEELGITNIVVENALCADNPDCTIEFDIIGGTGVVTSTFSSEFDQCDGLVILDLVDENGCSYSESFMLNLPEPLALEVGSTTIVNSTGTNGSIDINVLGGVAPYSYSWTDTNGNVIADTEDIDGLAPGIYTVQVVDSNGCDLPAMVSFEVEPRVATIDIDIQNKFVILSPIPAKDNLVLQFLEEIPVKLEVYNIQSQVLIAKNKLQEKENLHINDLPGGLYIVKLKYGDKIIVKTFVKT